MKKTKIDHYTDKEALDFHKNKKPGKIEINSSKSMTTKRDLALAYSPGVAAPVRMISENPEAAYDYTSKGNLVAVISNGSAILGMGNLGALASKPVMEGKAVLYADKVTGSMQRAMDETERRRELQVAHNKQHDITPKSIVKGIADIMEGAYAGQGKTKRGKKVAEGLGRYDLDEPPVAIRDIAKELKRLDEKMYQHARNLEFEEAAQVRDEIGKLRERSLAS